MAAALHPLIDDGLPAGSDTLTGGVLRCHCATDRVEVTLTSNVVHNHACGCTKCWKPAGALFSVIGAVPGDKAAVTAHAEKLHILDETAGVHRHVCTGCGVHMLCVAQPSHPFNGVSLVHVELADDKGRGGWQGLQFAGFVSSLAESGLPAAELPAVRARLRAVGLESYDALSPELMGEA